MYSSLVESIYLTSSESDSIPSALLFHKRVSRQVFVANEFANPCGEIHNYSGVLKGPRLSNFVLASGPQKSTKTKHLGIEYALWANP